MDIELLKEISSSIGGKNAPPIVDILFDKRNVNEFIIAKKLGLTINQARNILYKLSDDGLVSSTRKKDKKKGWYTYFWTFNIDRALLLLQKGLRNEIEQLEHQLKIREIKRFYICKICNTEITEENALLNDFACPECGEIYEMNDNKKAVAEISSAIKKAAKKLEEVENEITFIEGKKLKKHEREKKKQEKDKVARRKLSNEKRKRSRMASLKKAHAGKNSKKIQAAKLKKKTPKNKTKSKK